MTHPFEDENRRLLAEARDMIKGFSFGKRLASNIDAALAAEPASDEATRAENEACAKIVDEHSDRMDDWYGERLDEIVAAIRARIAPKGQDDD